MTRSPVLVTAACLLAAACSAGGGDEAPLDDASFISPEGLLLDGDLDRVGELALPEGMWVSSVSADAVLLFSSSIGATASQDCCGPNMESLFVLGVGDAEPEPLFPGEVGIADRNPDWAPGGDQVVFIRSAAPVYGEDGGLPGRRGVVEGLYVFTVGDDAPRLLVEGRFTRVEWSPDGRLIAATESNLGPESETLYVLQVFDAGSGAPVASADVDGFRLGWAPSSDRVMVEVEAPDFRSAVGLYDIDQQQLSVVPKTATLETFVWVWGPDGPIIELNRSQGSLLARVDPDDMTVAGLRRCRDRGLCPHPVEALRAGT